MNMDDFCFMDPTGVLMLTEDFNVDCVASNSKDSTLCKNKAKCGRIT